jgi:thiol-disulfide isomerase/thioredoxin
MKRLTYLTVSLAFVLLCGVGCQNETDSPSKPGTDDDNRNANVQTKAGNADEEVTVTVASWAEVQDMVSSHAGKVVVVDLWSTWCVPCMREFPNLVKLQDQFPDKVACISVNLNYDGSADAPPESHREEVLKFLTKRRAGFQNVICSDPDEKMYTLLDLGAIPAIYIYDAQGKVHTRFDNDTGEYGAEGFTYKDHVIPLVEEIIAKP